MIRLEQIRLLESKITKAVKRIEMLREENSALKRSVETAQKRMQELEGLVSEFKTDQEEIEKSLLRAIRNLDRLEDAAASGKEARGSEAGDPKALDLETPVPEAGGAGDGGPASEPRAHGDADGSSLPAEGDATLFEGPQEKVKKQELDIF